MTNVQDHSFGFGFGRNCGLSVGSGFDLGAIKHNQMLNLVKETLKRGSPQALAYWLATFGEQSITK